MAYRTSSDYIGKKVNMLTVMGMETGEHYGRNRTFFRCACDCGQEVTYLATLIVNQSRLSCGCERLRRCLLSVKKHKVKPKRAYRVWKNIRSRCNNPKTPGFQNYGGRGIKLHESFDDFSVFWEHLKTIIPEGFDDLPSGLTLDRIDNDKGYEAGNLRIADRIVQSRNRRNIKEVKIGEDSLIITDWIKKTGISLSLYHSRIKRGWSKEKALTTPRAEFKST